jgi:transcription elongation factor GreA
VPCAFPEACSTLYEYSTRREDHRELDRTDASSTGPLRLGQAISGYISTVPVAEREATARELGRFSRWIGDVEIRQISPVDVARYQEQFAESSVDVNGRLQPVKTFLTRLKTQKLTDANLGAHIRLRRPTARKRQEGTQQEVESIRVTEEGFSQLQAELEHLEKDLRPKATEDLQRAYADKDFRENAPYDAAKLRLGEIQTRINDIRRTLSAASIYTTDSADTVDLGTRVTLHDLIGDEEVVYAIVGPGEVSPRQGRISLQSPIGRALADRRPGEVVDVETPAGIHTYRIQRIERGR